MAHVGKLARDKLGDYSPQFGIGLMNKDFHLILEVASLSKLVLPATAAAFEMNSAAFKHPATGPSVWPSATASAIACMPIPSKVFTTSFIAAHSNGIGGDLFATVYQARDQRFSGLNGSGWAPAALTLERLRNRGFAEMPTAGIDTVAVPGTVDGWEKLLTRFGRMWFKTVLGRPSAPPTRDFP